MCKQVIDIVPLPGPPEGGMENGNREETKADERRRIIGKGKWYRAIKILRRKNFFFKRLEKEGLKS